MLLDAALHAVVLKASAERGQGSVLVPFSAGSRCMQQGASAVRARIAPNGSVGGVDRGWPMGWDCRCCQSLLLAL